MSDADDNQDAEKAVRKLTDTELVNGEELLASEELRRKYRKSVVRFGAGLFSLLLFGAAGAWSYYNGVPGLFETAIFFLFGLVCMRFALTKKGFELKDPEGF